jgi:xanthine dehydrogenase accessory factor
MIDTGTLLERLLAALAARQPSALLLVVAHHGSVPAGRQSMMLLCADDSAFGTIGGGAVEYEAMALARKAMQDGRPRLLHVVMTPETSGLPCGGEVVVLVAPFTGPSEPAQTVFSQALLHLQTDSPVTLQIQCLADPRHPDPQRHKTDGTRIRRLQTVTWTVAAGAAAPDAPDTFNLHLTPCPRLLIFGAGHIARALAPMALAVGFKVTVLDDRPEYLAAQTFAPQVATSTLADFANCMAELYVDCATWLLIATYGHLHDRTVLDQALATAAVYIGMVGSRNKRAALFTTLRASGWTPADLERVHTPVGLPIGAVTPAEIAVSILAQMITVRRGAH